MREKSNLALVTVVGEPGIGKSRLGFEFSHWLELLSERVRFFQGRPQPYGNNVPFGSLNSTAGSRVGLPSASCSHGCASDSPD